MESLYRNLPKLLVPWYRQHARQLPWRRDREPYHVWISEIMLQQTRVEAVKGYYARFLKALPAVEQLAAAEEGTLLKLWEGLGYYNRVRNMQKTARIIVDTYHGRFPQTAGELERLPGIGPYTAGAIASICFEQPAAAVDGNVLRVVARVCNIQSPVDLPQVKKEITSCLQRVYPAQNRGDFTQSMMELGATVCLPDRQPRCKACPLGGICRARQLGLQADLPRRTPKKKRRVEELTVFVLRCGGCTAVRRRPDGGLLAGLWELPNVAGSCTEEEALLQAAAWGTGEVLLQRKRVRTHVFTHVEWHMTCYDVKCTAAPERFTWASPGTLQHEIALPTAFKMFVEDPCDTL